MSSLAKVTRYAELAISPGISQPRHARGFSERSQGFTAQSYRSPWSAGHLSVPWPAGHLCPTHRCRQDGRRREPASFSRVGDRTLRDFVAVPCEREPEPALNACLDKSLTPSGVDRFAKRRRTPPTASPPHWFCHKSPLISRIWRRNMCRHHCRRHKRKPGCIWVMREPLGEWPSGCIAPGDEPVSDDCFLVTAGFGCLLVPFVW